MQSFPLRRLPLLLLALLFTPPLSGTLTPPQTRPAKVLAAWESGSNGVANIKLTIYKNHRFEYDMEIMPSLEEENGKSEIIRSRGTWRHKEGWTVLKFKNKKIDLATLFSSKSVRDGRCRLSGKHKVEIGGLPDRIRIWDIQCRKVKGSKPWK